MKCNEFRPGFELVSPCSFPTTITITPRAPPSVFLQWITFPSQLCLVLYSFGSNLLHSLIMWSIVSSLSPHNLHLLFCCVLSILALIWLVLMALFWDVIRRESVSLLRFLFISHIHVFSSEMSLVSRLKRPYNCFSSHFCFLFFFPRSADLRVISMVSGGCDQSSSTLFSVIFQFGLVSFV